MDEKVVMHREQLVSKCRDYINMICEKCGRKGLGRRPLNIAIVGAQGCGKSSFINSLAASLSQDTWIEYAMTGYRDGVNPVTNYISQYPECCNGDRQMYKTVLLPTLIDIPGPIDNDVDHRRKKFLQLLFYGHVKNSAAATQVYADCDRRWNDLLEKYFMVYSDMKVDRVIFVASAANERLPHSLMKCVMDAARPPPHFRGLKRQIPVYGVLTSLDKVNYTNREQFETNREEFMKALGLHEGRLLCCSNYCDLTDPHKERFRNILPSLDLPILEFFVQVCERKVHTVHDDDKMVDLPTQFRGVWRKLGSTWQPVVFSLALAIFAFILMYIVHAAFFTSEQDMLQERGDNDDQNIRTLSKVLQSTSSFRIAIVTALVTFVIAMRCHFD
ncbi:uncharacterized protein LOC112554844 [Pomacea canaliculata]|uniref:uncharacterized protein LOC112554844 n=1 Tax=Pomacea canaliculata TaxID=400727 RepID=UPI000D72D952|nr:uncharacterized protein LOC112554844 [Pomacea canaliculata]